jgi:hypothetical protein
MGLMDPRDDINDNERVKLDECQEIHTYNLGGGMLGA